MGKMKLNISPEVVKISEIKENASNPRFIRDDRFDKLVKSIKEFPEMLKLRPIVVNAMMVVLGGNMRLKACAAAGLKEVPIIKAEDLTPEQQREFIIKDNSGYGEWDMDMLANEWDIEQLKEWGIDMPDDWGKEHEEEPEPEPKQSLSTKLVVECGDVMKLTDLFNELQDRGFKCELKE